MSAFPGGVLLAVLGGARESPGAVAPAGAHRGAAEAEELTAKLAASGTPALNTVGCTTWRATDSVLDASAPYGRRAGAGWLWESAALLEPGFTVDAEAFAVHRRWQAALLRGACCYCRARSCSRSTRGPLLLDAVRRQNRLRRPIEYRHQLDRGREIKTGIGN